MSEEAPLSACQMQIGKHWKILRWKPEVRAWGGDGRDSKGDNASEFSHFLQVSPIVIAGDLQPSPGG